MKHKKLADALSELDDRHITEAAHYKKRSPFPWIHGIAAVLAVAILISALWKPNDPASNPTLFSDPPVSTDPLSLPSVPPWEENDTHAPSVPDPEQESRPPDAPDNSIHVQYLVATPVYPTMAIHPGIVEDGDYNAWRTDQLAMHTQPEGYTDSLTDFWLDLNQAVLTSNKGGNTTCSPVNIYIALAALAEVTGGESRQQILNVLGVDSIEDLRVQSNQVWQGHYNNDGLSTSILATSLWLQEGYGFNADTANRLAENYYASVFQGDLASEETNQALRTWLNEQTGGFMSEQIDNISMDFNTILALASTIYYQVQWSGNFSEQNNTKAVFHGVNGDTTEEFMNKPLSYGPYFRGEHFGAIFLGLKDGSRMWLFLPDEGYSPEEIVEDVHAFLQENPERTAQEIRVNLSIPKFDISADLDLKNALREMGITEIFDPQTADLTPILPQDDEAYIGQVKHSARVAIDENGITASAFTLILAPGDPPPPSDEIDFVLDRPFLFYVESEDNLPLFTGIVNNP